MTLRTPKLVDRRWGSGMCVLGFSDVLRVIAVVAAALTSLAAHTQQTPPAIAATPVGPTTAISFFWFGDMESHFRDPMNFYVVDGNDPKLHTVLVPQTFPKNGVSAFVSAAEMSKIKDQLLQTRAAYWQSGTRREKFKPFNLRGPESVDALSITLLAPQGTAKAFVRVARMCDELARFDALMPTPLILWQFQTMRWDNGCIVPAYENSNRPKE